MATRGRKPKPSNLKVISGTDRADRRNEAEPQVSIAMPDAPAHLCKEALVEWNRVCREMYDAGILSGLDRAGLAAYCQAYGRWVRAEESLARMAERDPVTNGLMIKTQSGNAIQNPLVGSANKAMADMMKYAAEFGMTPSARSRITALSRDEDDDPFARFDTA